ncbi:MAG: phosphoglycerate kinase [Thermoplasmatota archaeon]
MAYKEGEFFTLDDFDLTDKTVLLRVDINSPLDPDTGRILDDYRIRSHLETIKELDDTKLIIVAHQSRPGKRDYTTLNTHAKRMSQLLNKKVEYVDGLFDSHVVEKIKNMKSGDILLLENARFYAEETSLKGEKDWNKHSDTHIVRELTKYVDYFVHDAFAAAHRAQPTLVGFSEVVPNIAGRVMEKEIRDMGKVFENDERPKICLLGGLKVDDSLDVATHMLKNGVMDKILTMGVVGNVFLMAEGYNLGDGNRSFLKKEVPDYKKLVDQARELLDRWSDKIKIPNDVVLNRDGKRDGLRLQELPSKYPVFDIGLDTIVEYTKEIEDAKLILVNGPAGAFEQEEFSIGTNELFKTIADADAFSIVGGGHTTAVIEKLHLEESIDHLSTGGGSCINFLAGKELEGIKSLERSKQKFGKK